MGGGIEERVDSVNNVSGKMKQDGGGDIYKQRVVWDYLKEKRMRVKSVGGEVKKSSRQCFSIHANRVGGEEKP